MKKKKYHRVELKFVREPIKASIALQVKHARITRGWTQERLAKETGLKQSIISRLESGRHQPSLTTLEKIARKLGLNLLVLFVV
jgi:transcriptional regulator with XRE-family HTH domain